MVLAMKYLFIRKIMCFKWILIDKGDEFKVEISYCLINRKAKI